jgi:EAL domain-containing protein (putative c-di-GMP-specific phosphodiesterase class I)
MGPPAGRGGQRRPESLALAVGTDLDRLCLEVTERALAANPASAATTLKRLSALGVRVSVEGVETPGQLAKLDQLGCDYAQGHLFAHPRPPPASANSSATTAAGSRVKRLAELYPACCRCPPTGGQPFAAMLQGTCARCPPSTPGSP